MRKTINISGKEVELLATATTPIRFKQIFKSDLMLAFNNINKGKVEETDSIDIVTQMAYIMARQAENETEKLSEEDYFNWIDKFGSMGFINAASDIIDVYLEGAKTNAKPKNAASRPKGK